MAIYRLIYPKIWHDPDFHEIDAHLKLLFIFLFSNDRVTEAGLYPVTYDTIAHFTSIPKAKIQRVLENGELKNISFDKINSTVLVDNFLKYNGKGKKDKLLASLRNDLKFNSKTFLWEKFKKIYGVEFVKIIESPEECKELPPPDNPKPITHADANTNNLDANPIPIPSKADSEQTSTEIPYERMLEIFEYHFLLKNGREYANNNDELNRKNAKEMYFWCCNHNPESPLDLFDKRVEMLVFQKGVYNFFALWDFWNVVVDDEE